MRFLAAFCASVLIASTAVAALKFPQLTGHVVDDAHLLASGMGASLEQQLATYEKQSGHQLVVVTVPSLQGEEIESYGYQLGRAWGIGQKDKDDGVLLIVAPEERRVRIEVGYGLEGTLTDAASAHIVQTVILPEFKQGSMQRGIIRGVQAIETTLSGKVPPATTVAPPVQHKSDSGTSIVIMIVIAFFLFSQVILFALYVVGSIFAFIFSLLGFNALRHYLDRQKASILPKDKAFMYWLFMPSGRVTGSGGGGFSGFSGGGGSFGGGGSSGSW